MCHCDITPNEEDCALSLVQDLYISTITGWTDPKLEPEIQQPMREKYFQAWPVSVGQYITEIDVNNDDANVSLSKDWPYIEITNFALLLDESTFRYCIGQILEDKRKVGSKGPVPKLQDIHPGT